MLVSMPITQSTFFFYDLETSGLNPREARVMQFAGQRTDMDLKPIGDPVNILVKLTPDTLPEPDAILITGITPQATIAEGISEAEFLQQFTEEVATAGTIFMGYNTVRFDDEFMRYMLYRNFYDPYEWQWKDNRSRWDLLDVVRMTRALRPEGITWPYGPDGKPSNRLELLTATNKLAHENAHDALSDVYATIAVAKLIQTKQPKLFQFLCSMRDKRSVAALVETKEPFIYTANGYSSAFDKTTVAIMLAKHPRKQGVLVYDLREDPSKYLDLAVEELVEAWRWKKTDEPGLRLPVQTLQFNQCPAVAPTSVLAQTNRRKLSAAPDFAAKLLKALDVRDERQSTMFLDEKAVDAQLYDGFFDDQDKGKSRVVRAANPKELSTLDLPFQDKRLAALLPLYKARNFPSALSDEERIAWDTFCHDRLLSGGQKSRMARYFERLQKLADQPSLTANQRYLLEELRLYGETIMPVDVDA
jgi:exodeoxyribonuclease-1